MDHRRREVNGREWGLGPYGIGLLANLFINNVERANSKYLPTLLCCA